MTIPTLGADDAPIVIVEFSDFECPFCIKWHQEVWPQLNAAYGNKIKFIYRDFPLVDIHPNALPAAIAANCAAQQGQFWAFHDLLFAGQMELSDLAYEAYATRLELNLAEFKQCLVSEQTLAEITAGYG